MTGAPFASRSSSHGRVLHGIGIGTRDGGLARHAQVLEPTWPRTPRGSKTSHRDCDARTPWPETPEWCPGLRSPKYTSNRGRRGEAARIRDHRCGRESTHWSIAGIAAGPQGWISSRANAGPRWTQRQVRDRPLGIPGPTSPGDVAEMTWMRASIRPRVTQPEFETPMH